MESADYAQQQYDVTDGQLDAFSRSTDRRYQKLKHDGNLTVTAHEEIRRLLAKAARD